jgi:ribosomal protein S18 acetylase RimI-like enzyme
MGQRVDRRAFARSGHRIRPIDASNWVEVELVALRMRQTLVEVLGEERGGAMYTTDWLRARVLWHVDPAECTGAVFLSESPHGQIAGHSIVRVERDEAGVETGLFATLFVEPESRRQGIASSLIVHGEEWMRGQRLDTASTYTSESNDKLIALFLSHGYEIMGRRSEMVIVSRSLAT